MVCAGLLKFYEKGVSIIGIKEGRESRIATEQEQREFLSGS